MNSTEAATVFESLCVQLDQYDPIEATEKFCREMFAADSFTRVSSAKQVRDQGKELAEAEALRLQAGVLQPEPEVAQLNSNDAVGSEGAALETALPGADVALGAAAGPGELIALASKKQPQQTPRLIHAPLAPLTPRRQAEAAARRQLAAAGETILSAGSDSCRAT